MLGVFGAWALLGGARLLRLVEPPERPPGAELEPDLLGFFKATIPPDAGYLFVLPGDFGTDTGTAPRLRFELWPRRYDDVRASVGEAASRAVIRQGGLRFVAVPDGRVYAADSWLRQRRDWLRRHELDSNRYVLEVLG